MCHGVRFSMNFPESALSRQNKQASQESGLVSAHALDVRSSGRMSTDGRGTPLRRLQESIPRYRRNRSSSSSEYYLLAGNNQVRDSPTAVMGEQSEFAGAEEANGNQLHQQQQPPPADELGEDHHHDPTMPPETLPQQLNIKDGLVDADADDDTDAAVQVAAEDSSAASNHGVHHAHDNPCRHLQEVDPAAAAAAAEADDDIEIAPDLHLAHLIREFVEFIMSNPLEDD